MGKTLQLGINFEHLGKIMGKKSADSFFSFPYEIWTENNLHFIDRFANINDSSRFQLEFVKCENVKHGITSELFCLNIFN